MGASLTYQLVGARGGQGTTTVAAALALLAAARRPTVLAATRPDDVAALAGLPAPWPDPLLPNLALVGAGDAPPAAAEVAVEDLGRLSDLGGAPGEAASGRRRWLVVRGPCYLSLKAAVDAPWRPDGVVLVSEPGRALGASDIEAVLGVGVVVDVRADADVARCIDAGLLPARLHRLGAFRRLERVLAADLAAAGLDTASPPLARQVGGAATAAARQPGDGQAASRRRR